MAYHFEFDLTQNDLERFTDSFLASEAWTAARRAAFRRGILWVLTSSFMVFLGVVGMVATYQMFTGGAMHGRDVWPATIPAIAAALGYGYYMLAPGMIKRRQREEARAGLLPYLVPGVIGRIVLDIDDRGVRYRAVGTDVHVSWAGMRECHRSPHGLLLISHQHRQFIIPSRVLARPDDVFDFATRHVQREERECGLLREHLRTQHVACPACRYDMHGATDARCPECGRPVTLSDLTQSRTTPDREP